MQKLSFAQCLSLFSGEKSLSVGLSWTHNLSPMPILYAQTLIYTKKYYLQKNKSPWTKEPDWLQFRPERVRQDLMIKPPLYSRQILNVSRVKRKATGSMLFIGLFHGHHLNYWMYKTKFSKINWKRDLPSYYLPFLLNLTTLSTVGITGKYCFIS